MNTVPTPNQSATREWESEGGSLQAPPPTPLPDGVTAVTSVHYHVGPYTYSRLEDALAEHDRQSGK
ncbi:hypothetical protein [Croceicoccus naphthovorans]|uniref:hypothetical protein n=1 Tax=Croceicoccus naphthovorans TaxID=1348774 RepID=UPI000A51CE7D|nr:hypothetical protein [Croceicoccus naphthovorans]MBB3989099.1 hypothetical protein [Croceicoccus naphthovorans]